MELLGTRRASDTHEILRLPWLDGDRFQEEHPLAGLVGLFGLQQDLAYLKQRLTLNSLEFFRESLQLRRQRRSGTGFVFAALAAGRRQGLGFGITIAFGFHDSKLAGGECPEKNQISINKCSISDGTNG